MAPGTQLLCFLFLLLQLFSTLCLSATFVRWHGGLQSCGAETLLWFDQSGSFGSLGRIFWVEWTEWTEWTAWQRCSDAGDWPTLEHTPSDACRTTWVGIGDNCLVKGVLFIQLIELPKCALLFRSKLMQFILWPCSNSAGGCLLYWGSKDESRTRFKICS